MLAWCWRGVGVCWRVLAWCWHCVGEVLLRCCRGVVMGEMVNRSRKNLLAVLDCARKALCSLYLNPVVAHIEL